MSFGLDLEVLCIDLFISKTSISEEQYFLGIEKGIQFKYVDRQSR